MRFVGALSIGQCFWIHTLQYSYSYSSNFIYYMQFHLQLHELSDVCVRYRSSFTINYRALFPDECLGKHKAIRSTPVGEWMFLQVQKLSSWHSGSECWAELQWFGSLGGRDFIWRRVALFGPPLAAKLSISVEGLVWSCCESYPDALDTPEMPFWVWDMQAGRGVGQFVRSMATNSSLARRQMQIDFWNEHLHLTQLNDTEGDPPILTV